MLLEETWWIDAECWFVGFNFPSEVKDLQLALLIPELSGQWEPVRHWQQTCLLELTDEFELKICSDACMADAEPSEGRSSVFSSVPGLL